MPDPDPREAARLEAERYARCIEASRRTRWDPERDLLRGRRLDTTRAWLPAPLSRIDRLAGLSPAQALALSRLQALTWANTFELIERFICAGMLKLAHRHRFGEPVMLQALVGLADDALRQRALFERLAALAGETAPAAYHFVARPDSLARVMTGRATWAVLALATQFALLSQAHYRSSLDAALCPVWQDLLRLLWQAEAPHAVVDELEWRREDARCSPVERERGVDDLIALWQAIDGLLLRQADADTEALLASGRGPGGEHAAALHTLLRDAYRWQYLGCGVREPRFVAVLHALVPPAGRRRLRAATDALGDGAWT